ncbi:MAG TPA: hypothetical protein VLH39_06075 [Magnetospirillaceae bacterium]|nr:hypothetical protein [Magnetospirillaceae bacterium]
MIEKTVRHVCFLLLLAAPLAAQTPPPGAPVSPRLSALGGPHAADLAGFDSLLVNPAGLASAPGEWLYSRIALSAAGPLADAADLLLGGEDILANLTSLLDAQGRLRTSMDLGPPIAFGYVGKGLGVGVFSRAYADVNAPSISTARLTFGGELLLAGGYARRLDLGDGRSLDLGVAVKGFLRNEFAWTGALTDVPSAFDDVFGAVPFHIVTGVGLDFGAIWSSGDLALALTARDAPTPYIATAYTSYDGFRANPTAARIATTKDFMPIDLSAGVRWSPRWLFLARSGSKLTLLADYRNIWGLFRLLDRNPILELSLGAEVVVLEILSLRAGIRDALPAAGFGLDLQAFHLSLAMYGRELGLEPGQRPVFNLDFAIDFRY